MEEWIILKMKNSGNKISNLEDLVVLNDDGNMAIFPSLDAACDFREENEIDGQVIELPLY